MTSRGTGTDVGMDRGESIPGDGVDEARCRIAGDLIDIALPETHPMLTTARREALQQALTGGPPGAGMSSDGASVLRRRRALISGSAIVGGVAVAVAVLAGAGMVALRARPLVFEVHGGLVGEGGWVETAVGQRAQVRFSDGTSIALAESSAGRVTARTADGATFTIDRGHARFEVVHRARARWLVEVGPFEIAVTGTRFDVDWPAGPRHGLGIDLHAGSVVVRGALAGPGVPLHAGQRLRADLDRGTLVVVPDAAAAAAAAERAPPTSGRHDGEGERSRERSGGSHDEPVPPGAPAEAPGANGAADRVGPGAGERSGRGDKGRPTRGTLATLSEPDPSVAGAPVPPPPIVDIAPVPALDPVPFAPPPAPRLPLPADSRIAAGGSACLGWAPQVRFDRSIEGASAASTFSLAFTRPVLDRGRSWCGGGSLRVDARFDLSGAPNRFGDRPHHSGEALIELPAPVDLTGKTVTVHFFVEGPDEIRFGAQLFAVNRPSPDDAKWVGGGFTPDLTTGRWWTLSHSFERDNRLFEGGTSPVDRVEKVTLQIYAIGKDRVWTGRVFVDDLGWR